MDVATNLNPNPNPNPTAPASDLLDVRQRSLLRWRSRRGLVENDLFIERFFASCGSSLTQQQGAAFAALMELGDNDLMDLFLRRTEPSGQMDTPQIKEVLEMVRCAPAPAPATAPEP